MDGDLVRARARELTGLPKIGEGWLSETVLYNILRDHFEGFGREVLHHSYPPFLSRQELDIYIPSLRLGVEYQGLQHYEPISFFGGEKAFERRKMLDERKRRLCKKNNVILVEYRYDEPLEENYVIEKIYNAIK